MLIQYVNILTGTHTVFRYDMGLIPTKTSLEAAFKVNASSFCRSDFVHFWGLTLSA